MQTIAKFISPLLGICIWFSLGCDPSHKTSGNRYDVISIIVRAYDPELHAPIPPKPTSYEIGGVEKIYNKGDRLEYLFNGDTLGVGRAGEDALIAKLIQTKSANIIKITNPAHWSGPTGPAVRRELDAKYPWILDASNDAICKREIDRIRRTMQK